MLIVEETVQFYVMMWLCCISLIADLLHYDKYYILLFLNGEKQFEVLNIYLQLIKKYLYSILSF